MSTANRSLLDKLDDGVYLAEKVVVTVFFSVMSLVVFFDVVQRIFIVDGSRFDPLFTRLGASPELAGGALSPALAVLLTFGIAYAAIRERRRQEGTRANAAAWAAGVTVGLAVGLQLFLAAFPNGLVWSQTLGLSLMLWVGLIGASMAAKQRRHLALEIGSKIWPQAMKKPVRVFAGVVVAVFCAFLAYLAFLLIQVEFSEYDPVYKTGVFQGIPLPRFAVYAILPYAFFMIVVRYLRGNIAAGDVSEKDLVLAKQQQQAQEESK